SLAVRQRGRGAARLALTAEPLGNDLETPIRGIGRRALSMQAAATEGIQTMRMRSDVCKLFLVAAVLAPTALMAQALNPAAGGVALTAIAPGKGIAERVTQITASVQAVDYANRAVTLNGPAGDTVSLAVGDDVQDFDRIMVGDLVVVRYLEALTL